MITEDFVSFEIAKLLKEKGFDELCSYEWGVPDVDKGYILQKWTITNGQVKNSDLIDGAYTAPTQSLALKWLREVHKIHIVIYPYGEYSCDNYQFDVYKNNKLVISKDDGYITYEETCEAALLYVLKNLI